MLLWDKNSSPNVGLEAGAWKLGLGIRPPGVEILMLLTPINDKHSFRPCRRPPCS
jgi:hypothetical protein